jgi:hypothetical protein
MTAGNEYDDEEKGEEEVEDVFADLSFKYSQ